jgi:hypothetical protein
MTFILVLLALVILALAAFVPFWVFRVLLKPDTGIEWFLTILAGLAVMPFAVITAGIALVGVGILGALLL